MSGMQHATKEKEGLLLLHLSDIHFREPYCLNLDRDQDHPVRTALINDLAAMVSQLGAVDAVLVSGDIAFQGNAKEYEVASEWLTSVTEVAGCPETAVYTVPGNHDVDRKAANQRTVLGVRKLIEGKTAGPLRDKELHDTLLDTTSGSELFVPMAQYNRFAAPYECDLSPARPFWIADLALAKGWSLKMHGLTTTFLSGPDDDRKGELYLGALQRSFSPDNGVVRLAMMHHPPDWFDDSDNSDDALWQSCALHLLGHRHRQRYLPGQNGVRLAAAAVNPARGEGNWEPGYNIVRLRVVNDNSTNILAIESHIRIWQSAPDRFVPKLTDDDGLVFYHEVRLRRPPSDDVSRVASDQQSIERVDIGVLGSGDSDNTVDAVVPATPEIGARQMHKRDIVFRFWALTASQRRKIMQDLGLLDPDDDKLTETARYRRAFERAQERGMFDDIEQAVSDISAER